MKNLGLLLALCISPLFVGCSTTMQVKNMRAADEKLLFPATGRTTTLSTVKSFKSKQFKLQDINTALTDSIQRSRLFTVVATPAGYSISADLKEWRFPAGFTHHSALATHYVVKKGEETLYDRVIKSESKATVGDAVVGFKRARIAMERAVRYNIEMFIQDLSQLPTQ